MNECPLCKSEVTRDNVIPLYGRGCDSTDPRYKSNSHSENLHDLSLKLKEQSLVVRQIATPLSLYSEIPSHSGPSPSVLVLLSDLLTLDSLLAICSGRPSAPVSPWDLAIRCSHKILKMRVCCLHLLLKYNLCDKCGSLISQSLM